MLDTFARLLSSIPTFVFPVFASYKALKTADPALLKPWLMYWVVLAIALLFESWTSFILYWIPFYSWFRLIFLLYLILPQTQGARMLYQSHVHPFLHQNELAIDDFISSAHDRAKVAGATYLRNLFAYIKHKLLDIPAKEPTSAPPPSTFSYSQSLLARFNLPSARPAFLATTTSANDFYTLLASTVSAATSSGTSTSYTQGRDLSSSANLIPANVRGADRASFIAAQRERLSILLTALDREASSLQSEDIPSPAQVVDDEEKARANTEMSSSKSEPDFEKIDRAAVGSVSENGVRKKLGNRSSSSSWMPWGWGATAKVDQKNEGDVVEGPTQDESHGMSTGIDS